jgi:hypothetical protein
MAPKVGELDEFAQFLILCLKNVKDANGNLIQVRLYLPGASIQSLKHMLLFQLSMLHD